MNYIEDVLINNRKRAACLRMVWTDRRTCGPLAVLLLLLLRDEEPKNVNNYFMVHRLASLHG